MSDVLGVIIIPLVIIISLMMFMMRRGWIPSLFEVNAPNDENSSDKKADVG